MCHTVSKFKFELQFRNCQTLAWLHTPTISSGTLQERHHAFHPHLTPPSSFVSLASPMPSSSSFPSPPPSTLLILPLAVFLLPFSVLSVSLWWIIHQSLYVINHYLFKDMIRERYRGRREGTDLSAWRTRRTKSEKNVNSRRKRKRLGQERRSEIWMEEGWKWREKAWKIIKRKKRKKGGEAVVLDTF